MGAATTNVFIRVTRFRVLMRIPIKPFPCACVFPSSRACYGDALLEVRHGPKLAPPSTPMRAPRPPGPSTLRRSACDRARGVTRCLLHPRRLPRHAAAGGPGRARSARADTSVFCVLPC